MGIERHEQGAGAAASRNLSDAVQARRVAVAAGHRADLATAEALLDHDDAPTRAAALGAVHRAGGLRPDHLRRALADPDPRVRRRALEVAASLGDDPDGALDGVPLLPHLEDDDATVVEVAAFACGERRPPEPGAVARLAALATAHEDPLVREAAVAALGSIGDPGGLDAVLAACQDKATVRRRAVIALAAFTGPKVEEALARALEDRDWQVRQAAEDLVAVDIGDPDAPGGAGERRTGKEGEVETSTGPATEPTPAPEAEATTEATTESTGRLIAPGHVILVSRYMASRLAAARIEAFAIVPALVAALGLLLVVAALFGADESMVIALGGGLIVLGGMAAGLLYLAAAIVRHLGLSRRARPLAGSMARSWDRLKAELAGAGVPVGIISLLRFLAAVVLGRRPHQRMPQRVRDVAARFGEIVDAEGLRAELDRAAGNRSGADPGSPPPGAAS